MDIIFIFSGLVLLVAGGEGVVSGSVMIEEKLKLSKLLISTVVIGLWEKLLFWNRKMLMSCDTTITKQNSDGIFFTNSRTSNFDQIIT